MRLNGKQSLVLFAIVFLALPVYARTVSLLWTVSHPVMLAGTQVQPGDYELKTEEGQTQLQVERNGKVIVEVTCKWIQLPAKAASDQVLVSDGHVTQIDFSGRTEALQCDQQ